MAMDDESFVARWPRRPKPKEILATLSIARIGDYFVSEPPRASCHSLRQWIGPSPNSKT